jgi:radical SAM protein with 4Fe4S-binding SPASM domain
MIEYAKKAGVKEVSSLTHGGMLDEEKFRKLIKLELDWLTISFDGLDEEYNKIRAPNNFDDQVAKIKRFSEIKKELNVVKPLIKIQTISSAIENNADEFYNTFSSISDQIASNPLIDFSHTVVDENFLENFTCPQPWQRLVIGSDGKAMMCAMDEMGTYIVGDLNEESIRNVWHGKKMKKAREIHMKELGVKELPPCQWCIYPRKTESKNVLVGDRTVNSYSYENWDQTNKNTSKRYRKKEK